MKKHFFAIIFLIAAFTLIAHDIMPHHHSEMKKSELNASQIFKDSYDDHAEKESDHDHHDHHIPHHQHAFASGDNGWWNNNSAQKVIKITITNSCFFDIIENHIPENNVFISLKILPDPYPFIISPNAMRGSPANA